MYLDLRKAQSARILLGIYGIDIEKSKVNIGEIREWGGKKYRKVDSGKWVEIKETKQGIKEREVAQSGMKKVIISEINKHREILDRLTREISKKWGEENNIDINNIWNIGIKVKLSKFLENDDEVQEARRNFSQIRKDLSEDLEEVENLLQKQSKLTREEKNGKKEIDTNSEEYKSVIQQLSTFNKILNEIPSDCSPSQALGEITVDNYWLNTDTLFRSVYEFNSEDNKGENNTWKDGVKEKWEEMKVSKKYEHTFSPKSSSEYLVDRVNGDIYRMSDHWGRCASCYWVIDKEISYAIAKCNVKDFKRNDRNSYYNPEKIKAILSISSKKLIILKELLENENQYLDKTSSSEIKIKISYIRMNLASVYHDNNEEVKRLREEYKSIFEFEFKK